MNAPGEQGESGELHSDTNKRKLEENIQLAKQKAQEIVAKLVSNAESKRPRFDYEPPSAASTLPNASLSSSPFPGPNHGFQSMSKKMNIPNIKVGLIIGKGGETIKYLQQQSGAKIQITRDSEADPQSLTREVELVGTSEQVSRAEQLINEVIAETDTGASASSTNQGVNSVQPGVEQLVLKIPNNKVALLIGKGGETIKSIQSKSAARVQVIPLHLPPGDTSTERNVYINGLKEQVESAKELINEVISGKRLAFTTGTTSYVQPTYPTPGNWAQAGQPLSQQQQQQPPQYGYAQGTYLTPPAPSYYGNYPTQGASWDPSSQSTIQPSDQTSGYNYYGQQPQTGSALPTHSYSYSQTAPISSHGYDQGYSQQAPNYGQNFSAQVPPYDQQNLYPNSGYGPPAATPDTDGTSSIDNQPSVGYQPNNQPMATPTGYWSYPSGLNQPFSQTGNDQSGYYQTVGGGQEQPLMAPHSAYGQVGYLPQGLYSHGPTPPAPVPPQTQPVGGIETSGEGNLKEDQGSAPSVQETAISKS